jgi:hypothetical protein
MDCRVRPYGIHTSIVIAGLDPAIHRLSKRLFRSMMDTRVKPAYDEMCESSRVKPGNDSGGVRYGPGSAKQHFVLHRARETGGAP